MNAHIATEQPIKTKSKKPTKAEQPPETEGHGHTIDISRLFEKAKHAENRRPAPKGNKLPEITAEDREKYPAYCAFHYMGNVIRKTFEAKLIYPFDAISEEEPVAPYTEEEINKAYNKAVMDIRGNWERERLYADYNGMMKDCGYFAQPRIKGRWVLDIPKPAEDTRDGFDYNGKRSFFKTNNLG